MKYKILLFLLTLGCMAKAQMPVAKVDINMEGRRESEVNEDGYTPWYIQRVANDSITVSGVTFTVKAIKPDGATMRASWSKALVQSPYYMKLVNDGIKIDNDSLLAHPGIGAAIELHIKGLPKGAHLLQTYHNLWQDTTKTNYAPMNVYLNGELINSRVDRSIQAKQTTDATILTTVLDVAEDNEDMVLTFEADTNFVATAGKARDLNVCINGFELNTSNALKQARNPLPADGDLHLDADSGSYKLQWQPAMSGNVVSHTLYFGTDSAEVAGATPADEGICKGALPASQVNYIVEDLYSMNTYFWRVDETDSDGVLTQGNVWTFRPRHLAFPGAEGYGRFAIGGRGGKVVYVTNLDDSGPGSFRDAVENQHGRRTILFAVSGLITLKSRLVINDDYVTVAGQTAPGKGVCFRWAPIGVVGDDLIVRNLRVRLGIGVTFDGMGLTGADHSIIDHCSISWTIDEAFSSRGAHNITLQKTLISEPLNEAGHSNYSAGARHGFAASIGGDIGSFHHNLLAHSAGRNWSLAGGLDGDGYYAGKLDITNNVVYNWDGRTTDGGAHEVNFVNNYYKMGAASENIPMLTAQLEGTGKGSQSYYYSGNVKENTNGTFACDGTDNTCGRNYQQASSQVLDWDLWVDKPFFPSYTTTEPAKDAFKIVLSDVGCTQPVFDDHDKRIIKETREGTFSIRGSKTNLPGLPDNEQDVGGWEAYPGFSRSDNWDTDLDGLPDWWENTHGLNANSAKGSFADSNADDDMDGYTNLEDYLHWMANPHYFMLKSETLDIDLSNYTRGFTNKPKYVVSNTVNGNAALAEGSSVVSFTAVDEGMAEFTFTVTDSEGTSMTQKVGIYVGPVPDDEAFSYSYYKDRNQTQLVNVKIGTGIDQLDGQLAKSGIVTYPNPVENTLDVEVQSPGNTIAEFRICDLAGRTFHVEKKRISQGFNLIHMNSSKLAPGIYFLTVRSQELDKSAKFIKK